VERESEREKGREKARLNLVRRRHRAGGESARKKMAEACCSPATCEFIIQECFKE